MTILISLMGLRMGSCASSPAQTSHHQPAASLSLPLVIPQPRHMVLHGSPIPISSQTQLVLASGASPEDKLAAQTVRQELMRRFGLAVSSLPRRKKFSGAVRIVFGESPRQAPAHAEGYAIRVRPGQIAVWGHDPVGTFYGAQTLCQLLENDKRRVFMPRVQVDDWPALPWRGVHLWVDNQSLPFHEQLIRDVLARYKINNLVLECEQTRWNALGPNVAPWAATKAELRAEVAYANRYHITVTPLIESVGHMGWLLGGYPKLREDPAVPFAANVSSPQTYALLDRIYDEAIQTFHAKALVIGGDEVTQQGRYPFASRAQYPTAAAAYVACVTRLHDHLKAHGVRTMLWGDMLLGPGEAVGDANAASDLDAAWIRAALPHDIQILDWRYHARDNFRSPALFTQTGFGPVIGATWNDPSDIAGFVHALAAAHGRGLLQTTWVQMHHNAAVRAKQSPDFQAIILAAEYAWSNRPTPPRQLPYDPAQVFRRAY